jgi:hypothetical protein
MQLVVPRDPGGGRVAVEQLPALWSRHRQTRTERLAGTVVVAEP